MRRACIVLGVVGFVTALSACDVKPPKGANQPTATHSGGDDWSRTALWLHATAGAGSGNDTECKAVAALLLEEAKCERQLCRFGAELGEEWLEKCAEVTADLLEGTSDAQATMSEQAERSGTPCSGEHTKLLDNCPAESCLEDAQTWATDCGEEGGPLAKRMLERHVERSVEGVGRVRLDTRSCDSMAAGLADRAKCIDEDSCKEALEEVEGYRELCEDDDDPPEITVAVWQQMIMFGAAREMVPVNIADDPALLPKGSAALQLSDNSGAILKACYDRPQDFAGYMKNREGCTDGNLWVLRKIASDEEGTPPKLKVGKIHLPLSAKMSLLYPSLLVDGEKAAEDKALLGAFKKRFAAAPGLGGLITSVAAHGRIVGRSKEALKLITARDADFVEAFVALGKAKAKALSKVRSPAGRHAFLRRSRQHPLSDVNAEGVVEPELMTGAAQLDVLTLLPKSGAAYLKELKQMARLVQRGPRPASGNISAARKLGSAQAKVCGKSLKRVVETQADLLACVFDECSAEQQGELELLLTTSQSDAAAAKKVVHVALSAVGKSLQRAVDSAGCKL